MNVQEYSEVDIFSTISKRYDFLNQMLSFGIDIYWRAVLLRMIAPYIHKDTTVLDLATGTFDIAKAIAKKSDATVLAMDYSFTMLHEGISKIGEYPSIIPLQADGRNIPLQANSVDIVTISFGIRNILPRSLVFNEWYRVLRSGGRMYILEFCNPNEIARYIQPLYRLYISKIIPFIASICKTHKSMYEYLSESIHSFPMCIEVVQELKNAGFTDIVYTKHSFGIVAIYSAIKE